LPIENAVEKVILFSVPNGTEAQPEESAEPGSSA
jgi:hypothetical protein